MVKMEFGELAVFISDEIDVMRSSMNKECREDWRVAASFIETRLLAELKDFFEECAGVDYDNSCELVDVSFEDLGRFIRTEIGTVLQDHDPWWDQGEQVAHVIRCILVDRLRSFFEGGKNARGLGMPHQAMLAG
jgi:hypothetical protein